MYQPQYGNQRLWYRGGAQVAGIVIAGQCIVVLLFLGFGLLLMGAIATAASSAFDDTTNVPRLIGTIFLGFGGFIFLSGLILLIFAVRAARKAQQNTQPGAAQTYAFPGNAQPLVSGATQPMMSGNQVQSYQTGIVPPPVQSGQAPYGQPSYPQYNDGSGKVPVANMENRAGVEPCPYPAAPYNAPPTGYSTGTPSAGTTGYPTNVPSTGYPGSAPPTGYPTGVPPTGYPTGVPPTSYPYTDAQSHPNAPPPPYFEAQK